MVLPARVRKRLHQLAEAFWPVPALLGLLGVVAALGLVSLDAAACCRTGMAPVFLPTGVHHRSGRLVLAVPNTDYDGVADAMFHMIRQNAAGSTAVLMRMLDVLAAVASCEHDPARRGALRRHADLVRDDAARTVGNASDRRELRARHAAFVQVTGRQ